MIVGLDFDGTLVDCRAKQLACLTDAAKEAGVSFDAEELWRAKRAGDNNRAALGRQGVAQGHIDVIEVYWREFVESDRYAAEDQLFPGVREALFKERSGFEFIIISGRKNSALLLRQIEALGLSSLLSDVIVVCHKDVQEQKQMALTRSGAQYYIGDTETDFFASISAGATPLIVDTGQRSRDYLEMHGISPIFGRFSTAAEAVRYV